MSSQSVNNQNNSLPQRIAETLRIDGERVDRRVVHINIDNVEQYQHIVYNVPIPSLLEVATYSAVGALAGRIIYMLSPEIIIVLAVAGVVGGGAAFVYYRIQNARQRVIANENHLE